MAAGLIVEPALQAIVRVGVVWLDVRRVLAPDPALEPVLAAAERTARAGDVPDTGPARSLFKAIGLDPTRTRPSSEALLRRVRRGEPVPRINTLVDICNWCSLEVQLPFGLYDAATIAPPVTLGRGHDRDAYAGIRKDVVHLDGRLVLFDERGPFGNPTSDSARTMTTTATRQVMTVVFAPAALTRGRMTSVIDMTALRLAEYAEGRETGRWVN